MVSSKVLKAIILGAAVASMTVACSKKDNNRSQPKPTPVQEKAEETINIQGVSKGAMINAGLIDERDLAVGNIFARNSDTGRQALLESTKSTEGDANVLVGRVNDRSKVIIVSKQEVCAESFCDENGEFASYLNPFADEQGRIRINEDMVYESITGQ